ncbi:hypothetical protein C5N14_29880 [Micromonospora sp. MW-13]|uniref:CBM96 family carbohydrate-binding protein n=1 Tax=Micromonospora sp. MW-13 TaxID=2094022 RepID=UPI000E43D6A1|nr:hypothetical protein [Micromonospora sp. MW-13]RGC65157.1 hypothetical protein C5N14_29880 [Micromonospora sp. MW-13]
MTGLWPRRGLAGLVALTLGVTGLAVITTGGAAAAAPHTETPPSVQVGWTDSATPAKAYNLAEQVNLPLGTRLDEDGVSHTSRVYATFDLSQFEGRKIYDGKVFVTEYSAADCTKRAVEIWRTKPVGTTPTWNRRPAPLTKLDEVLTPNFCPKGSLTFDVGAAVQDAMAHKQRRVTFEIRVPEQFENDPAYGRTLSWSYGVRSSVDYNSLPTIDSGNLYNGGVPCTQLKPYPRLGGFANVLQALGADPDEWDQPSLVTEYAVWPKNDATARTVFTADSSMPGRVSTVNLPAGTLVDGKSYGWQARAGDGTDLSAWSKKCFFTYDGTAPTTPTVSSANYPPFSSGESAPVGVPATFTFSGNGNKDVAGFEYGWNGLGVPACAGSGDVGQLECPAPFSRPNSVRADAPGGSATVTLSPVGSGPQRLTVRSIDLAGNRSEGIEYMTLVPSIEPEVRVEGGQPEWGQDVLLKLVPANGMTGVIEYEITLDGGKPVTRQAEEDGTAYFRFTANNPDGHRVSVRSHSANGFVSPTVDWSTYFLPWPGVKSDVYYSPEDGHAVGGVGVPGTFTFSPPPGWTDVAGYRYSFNGGEVAEAPAGGDGRATISWTPTEAGYVTLIVHAVKADGTWSDYPNWYSFEVAATTP